ncbi:hypothetical protein DFJ73DRAFT_958267 [Zopfochytrium polystomum]|nr:hypothetical protein DFJ73DRAFT_958267 [Zopfochytrium polystomum]
MLNPTQQPSQQLPRPSHHIAERSLSIEERLIQAARSVHRPRIIELVGDADSATKVADVSVDRPLFEPLPPEIILQSYEPFNTYEVVISFRNNDKFTRRLKLEPISHPNFKVSGVKSDSLQSGKVAPGMEVQFMLTFNPEEKVDYVYNLVCITEREKFLLPIRAIGARGALDFPDEIAFGECPVRFTNTRTLYVRNIGDRAAKFQISIHEPFEAEPKSGCLEVNDNMQIDINFKPETAGSFQGDMTVTYDTGEAVRVTLRANAENANIRLEKSSLKMDSTYISLSSSKSIRIFNRSDIMARYEWKRFETPAEDAAFKKQRKEIVYEEEQREAALFHERMIKDKTLDLCDLAPLLQRFKNHCREIDHDPLLAQDSVFSVQPISGVIWPNSHVDIRLIFAPKQAGACASSMYCEVSGRQHRLPFLLKGEGIGPKARFLQDSFNLEQIFVNTHQEFELLLENRGEIEFGYSLIRPGTLFGPKFSIFPEKGRLKTGQQQVIHVKFVSEVLGSFHEEFRWELEGAPDKLCTLFYGSVVGPNFHFGASELNFGQLSYGFLDTQSVELVNSSHIPMEFSLAMSCGEDGEENEFQVTPSAGRIAPLESVQISVAFTPKSIRSYDEYLWVDVKGVGEQLKKLPILAQSVVPEISLVTPNLDYGDTFLSHPYLQEIEISNQTAFYARFELLSQDENAKGVYSYSSLQGVGVIPPHSTAFIPLDVQIKRLGQINFPVFVKIHGVDDQPLGVDISANGIGPNVIFSSTEINWGKIPVLKETAASLTLMNSSPISAHFTCAMVSEPSPFKVEPTMGTIAPGASVEITVTACLDDSLKFTEILKVGIQSDGIHEVQLVARGQGTTITFDEGLKNVDFQDVFSNRECSREFTLVNRGQRVQTLHWLVDEDRFARKDANALLNQTFEVIPTRFTLKPNGSQVIVIKGYSSKAMRCKETLVCQSTIDKDPSRKIIIETTVLANFINPLLDISPSSLRFISAHTRDDDFELISQDMTLRNTSTLPLHLSLRCPTPYTAEPNEIDHRLNQGESVVVTVRYDPKFNTNRVSCKEHAKLWISYSEHPQKDFVELYSEITFPNLAFSTNTMNFGCIPNDTEHRRILTVTNSSSLPVEYSWSYLEGTVKCVGKHADIPISQVFDILPLRSTLQPGESEPVEISFFGHAFSSYGVTAMCDVVGGPKYEICLRGEASTIEYAFDRTSLDFGQQPYQDILEQEIILTNTGLVVFDFNTIIFPNSVLSQKIAVNPSSGTIAPHGKQKITVRFCACVPEVVNDCFYFQIALFEPIEVHVRGTGTFPYVNLGTQRAIDSDYSRIVADVKQVALKEGLSDEEVDLEAERILLTHKTNAFLKTLAEDCKVKLLSMPKTKACGSTILIHKMLQRQGKDKRSHNSIVESSQVVLANYICNFGNVIRNTNRKKMFKLTNKSRQPINFQMDKSILLGTGFSIEPDRVKSLPGHPHHESVEFQVAFQARNQSAEVTLPELLLSTNEINFGEVVCGMRQTVAIHIQNKNTVPCEWSSIPPDSSQERNFRGPLKKKANATAVKEFDLVPPSGVLQPGEKSILLARFSPTEEKDYDTVIPIKITMNSTPVPLHIFGRGFKPVLTFEPESLSLGPILPCAEGTEARFSIINPTSHPIEIYSVEFDQVYLEEEEVLRHYDGFEGNCLFIPPREPGHGLPEFIIESFPASMRQDAGVGELIETGVRGGRGSTPFELPNESWSTVVIHGPPYAGRTTQARNIEKTFGHAYIRLDDLFEASPLSEILSSVQAPPDTASSKKETPKVERSELSVDDKPEKERSMSVAGRRTSALPNDEHFDHGDDHRSIPEEALIDLIKTRLHKEDCCRGIVIDGLDSKYTASPLITMKLFLRAFGEKKKVLFFHLILDPSHIREREMISQKIFGDIDLDSSQMKTVSEEEYDAMTEAEKDAYDSARAKFRKRFKEIQDKRKQERKVWEEEMALRLGERKAEEDTQRSTKKKGARLPSRPSFPPDKMDKSGSSRNEGKGGKEKGSTSPKMSRKLNSEKSDKSEGKGDRSDKWNQEGDEFSSRFGINDLTETFYCESTMRKVESYLSTIEGVLSLIRDSDRIQPSRQLPPSASVDKKAKSSKGAGTAASVSSAAADTVAVSSSLDADNHGGDESSPLTLREINAALAPDAVFKVLSESIPSQLKSDDAPAPQDVLPQPYMEQIIHFPAVRDSHPIPKCFHLVPCPPQSENDEETAPPENVPPVREPQAVAPTPAPNKKGKPIIKVAEDVKPVVEQEDETEKESATRYRWIIPPKENKDLMIKFNSNEIGKFEHVVQFEMVGSRAKYGIPVVGVCRYAQIAGDPKKIFPKWKKSKEEKYVSHGEYISNTGTFEFGPLLYSKPRERYLEKFPENRAILNINNPTLQEIKVSFALRNDIKSEVFFFDPANLDVQPGQTQSFTIWAYPRSASHFEDTLIICVKDNPEPYCFKVSCIGVKPELEIDKRQLSFDKLLLGRSEKRELKLKNNTLLPVAWRLAQVELLGDEFTVVPLEGVIEPYQEQIISAEFRGSKPVVISRRSIRLEVFDTEKVSGVVQEVPITVTAESGYEGGLDFSVLKVMEEGKQMCTLKNKGKYEVGYRFIFDSKELAEVQVVFKANREMVVRDNNSLKCQFYEPATGESISILPVRDLNFGALVYWAKGSRQFTVENLGEFDFRYSIYKIIQGISEAKGGGAKLRTNSRASKAVRSNSPPTQKVLNKKELVKQTDATNFGAFTVFPTSGIVPAGAKHQVTVEFHSDVPGSFEETVAIDISDRSPNDYLDVIEYRLIGESCVPAINTSDFASIFEEQTVCKRLELFNTPGNVYAEEDRVFLLRRLSCGPAGSSAPKDIEPLQNFAFDLEPKKMTIPSHEYRYVTVYFHPTSIQSYAGLFEAVVENIDQTRSKNLTFELRGEGTLPRVVVERPILRNKAGWPWLKFRRLLVGGAQSLPIVLRNEGITPAKVKLEWTIKESDEFECNAMNIYHSLRPQETRSISVTCKANSIRKLEGEMKLRVIDNSFEDTLIQLSGEGYLDEITFSNLPNDAESEINLGDCFMDETKQATFTISSSLPRLLTCGRKAQREFTVSFQPKQPIVLSNVKAVSKLSKIRYLNQTMDLDWDDKAKSVRWVMNESKSVAPRKVIETFPEPPFETLPSAIVDHVLSVSVAADYSSYECDTSSIKFKSTLMYQTRVFRFNLRNPGKIVLQYEFVFVAEDGHQVEPETEECPFGVSPFTGHIEAGGNAVITARFAPLDDGVYNFFAYCAMKNLPKDAKPLAIKMSGASMRPFCHFELEESDYITSERRNPENGNNGVPSVLPPNTRAIEFGSCGVKVRNTKRFYIVNPTSISYDFEWSTDSDQKVFRCMTPRGTVASNKKFEIIFEFIPETVDLKESFWKFNIIGHNITIPFLLVGQAMEPSVYMDRVSINFKSLLVGRQSKETVKLINSEAIPFAFSFNETSFELGSDNTPVLRFSPSSGTIGAHSEVPIEISFTPSAEKMFNFNLICNVKRSRRRSQSTSKEKAVFELAAGLNAENVIDFGQVQLNEKRVKRVTIVNSGKFNFDFSWRTAAQMMGMISVNPEIGTVSKGDRVVCEITFVPTSNITLKNVKVFCQIVNGRTYPLMILGSGCRPLLKFSALSHDFETQFVYKPGMTPSSTKITVTNSDLKEISFDIIYNREKSVFDVQRGVGTLAPGESTDLDIFFFPKEARVYEEVVKFEINGLSTIELSLVGVGAECKLEMAQPDTKNMNFGATRVGHVVTRSIRIINKSVIPATFSLGPPTSIESLANHSVSLSHQSECTLRPKGVLNLEFKFQPTTRIPPFAEEIFLEAPGMSKPLLIVSGACQGIDIKIENDTLPFGAVVQKSCTTRRLQLQNLGDIGAKFHWDAARFSPDFSISPTEGYISPGMDLPLEITFHPTELNQDIRYEGLMCMIEGASPLVLTLTGMCIPQPIQNDAIKFSTPVRQTDVKSIRLENKTPIPWHICPIIENEYWNGPESIDVEPMQSKSYDLSFTPMEMVGAGDGGRHEGCTEWQTSPRLRVPSAARVPCKTGYTELLSVANWLKKPQRFKVLIEVAKPDPSVVLRGLDFVDVPPLTVRDYKLQYYAYKEGATSAKVVFKNEQTQEFIFYAVSFKSTPPGVISTVEMSTTVRQLCTREITIANPLPNPVAFTALCNHSDITVTHSFSVQPKSDGVCLLEYLPLQAKESTARLTLTSVELGVYQYDLRLIATPGGPERSLHFKVGLGGSQTQTFRFLSFAKAKTEYSCKIDSPDFTVEKSAVAPSATTGGVEVCIDVTYEPSKLGDVRTQLLVSSSVGGDYLCPLYGHCIAPRPQGPITIKAGSTASVPFKNVFSSTANFSFVVDNVAFSVKAQESIAAKKVVTMVITAHSPPSTEPKGQRVGKLTVTNKGGANESWIYYLRQS